MYIIIILVSSPIQSSLNISVTNVNCEIFVQCTAIQRLDISNCIILYGTDDFTSIMKPTNEMFPLSELDPDTTYYLEAVFTIGNNGVLENYRLQTTFRTCKGEYMK